MQSLAITIAGVLLLALLALGLFVGLLLRTEAVLRASTLGVAGKFVLFTAKNLRRNLLRTALTFLAIFVLAVVVTMVWSILDYVEGLMTEKTSNIKTIVSEKWSASSNLPFAYAAPISAGAADSSRPGDIRPMDAMTWQFYIGTMDPEKKTRENFVFLIALEPIKIVSMMNELLEEITPAQRGQGLAPAQIEELHAAVRKMQQHKQGIIIGRKRLEAIQKRVGDRFTLTGINYTELDLEFDIVGVLPESGRYDETAFMNRDYLNDKLDAYPKTHGGQKHKLADRSLNLVWLKVADQHDYGRIAWQIESSGSFHNPPVKCETLSSAITTVMESYRDLVWGMRWLLSPAILVTMSLVVANAISLSVRERRTELAVMKVLGYRPGQILTLVLGEALLIGTLSGLLSTAICYGMVNWVLRTVNPLPMAIPASALWWGPALGAGTALLGSCVPAVQACRIKVSEVFARVT
ncbi:hypothetical protein AYO44_02875 [Planctomycetaceae bacterium SCGC AG-212-F19]|nr:hypothetical protein AYO44_02875 [Planctomycetaceae bacterium SCGC AG-212-F19]